MRVLSSRPSVSAFVNPTLGAVHRLGGIAPTREINRDVLERLADEWERDVPFARGELSVPASYARTYLKIGGLLEQPATGTWKLAPGVRTLRIDDPEEIVRVGRRWYRGGYYRDPESVLRWRTELTGAEIFDPHERITAALIRGSRYSHPYLAPASVRLAYDELRKLLRKWAPEYSRYLRADRTDPEKLRAVLSTLTPGQLTELHRASERLSLELGPVPRERLIVAERTFGTRFAGSQQSLLVRGDGRRISFGYGRGLPGDGSPPPSRPPEDEAPEPPPPSDELAVKARPRYPDYTLFDDEKRKERHGQGQPLQVGKTYYLEVAVRERPIGLKPMGGEPHKPIREPRQRGGVKVLVTIDVENPDVIQVTSSTAQWLHLPPSGDTSKNVVFNLHTLKAADPSASHFTVRLHYRYNLLEAADLGFHVLGTFDRVPEGDAILLRQDTFNRGLIGLKQDHVTRALHIDVSRRAGDDFRLAFTFRNDEGVPVLLSETRRYPATHLEDALVRVRDVLYRIKGAPAPEPGSPATPGKLRETLEPLVQLGRELWNNLFYHTSEGALRQAAAWLEEHPFAPGAVVSVTIRGSAEDFVFPWPVLMPKDAPETNGIPPFWGLLYVVEQRLPVPERHIEPPDMDRRLKVAMMRWKRMPHAEEQLRTLKELRSRSEGRLHVANPIDRADECEKLLAACDAHILYFYSHGYTRARRTVTGTDAWRERLPRLVREAIARLKSDDPDRDTLEQQLQLLTAPDPKDADRTWIQLSYGQLYLAELLGRVPGPFPTAPVVVLNMCESAEITPSLNDSFVKFFLDRGARVVIGTECPMTPEFAGPFGARLLEEVLAGRTFGEAMLQSRRHFVTAQNNPLGLAYSIYGQASASFTPPVVAARRTS